jgi:hypothetical protein
VIFNSAWIAGVDHDEELFDDDIDDDYDEEKNDEENENENENNDHYDEMDENDMADILQQPNDVPHETKNEHKIVFEEANNAEELQEEEVSSDDDDEEYEPGNDEDILLEADDDDGEEEDDQGKRLTGRVRVPPTSWQHLQAREEHTEHVNNGLAAKLKVKMIRFWIVLSEWTSCFDWSCVSRRITCWRSSSSCFLRLCWNRWRQRRLLGQPVFVLDSFCLWHFVFCSRRRRGPSMSIWASSVAAIVKRS